MLNLDCYYEQIGSSSGDKDLGMLVDARLDMTQLCALIKKNKQQTALALKLDVNKNFFKNCFFAKQR